MSRDTNHNKGRISAIPPGQSEEPQETPSTWLTYMSRFSQYVNNSVKDNNRFIKEQASQQVLQPQPQRSQVLPRSPSNQNFPRRPMTLLEQNPLRHGL